MIRNPSRLWILFLVLFIGQFCAFLYVTPLHATSTGGGGTGTGTSTDTGTGTGTCVSNVGQICGYTTCSACNWSGFSSTVACNGTCPANPGYCASMCKPCACTGCLVCNNSPAVGFGTCVTDNNSCAHSCSGDTSCNLNAVCNADGSCSCNAPSAGTTCEFQCMAKAFPPGNQYFPSTCDTGSRTCIAPACSANCTNGSCAGGSCCYGTCANSGDTCCGQQVCTAGSGGTCCGAFCNTTGICCAGSIVYAGPAGQSCCGSDTSTCIPNSCQSSANSCVNYWCDFNNKPDGTSCAGGACCSGACTSRGNSGASCTAGCNASCASGLTCDSDSASGTNICCDSNSHNSGGSCVANCTNTCSATPDCGTGDNCSGSCASESACGGTTHCGAGYSCNGGACQNAPSETSCGVCGTGYKCGSGSCNDPGYTYLGGSCGVCSDGSLDRCSDSCSATESLATWKGGSVSPGSINPGGTYTVACDFNAVNGGVSASPGNASIGGTCSFTSWIGTAAQFTCTAGHTAGADTVTCYAAGATNEFCANESPNPKTASAGPITVDGPAAPSGVTPSCPFPGNSLTVSWNAVGAPDPAVKYFVRADDNADGATISPPYPTSGLCVSSSGRDICADNIVGTSYTGAGTGYDTYNIWVFAMDQYNNWSQASAPETMNALCVGQPTSPVINSITCPSPGSWLTVTWSADMHAASYKVQVIDNTSNTTVLPTTNVGNVLTYSLATNPGDQFTVNVWACDSSGNCSNPTPAGPVICTALGTPTGLTGSTFPSPCAAPGTSMTLNWTGVANAQTYNVLVHDQNTSTNISAPGLVVTSYNAVTTPGDEYNYTVQACQVDGNSHNTCGPTATSPTAGYIDCQLPDPTITSTCNGISNWLIQLAWSPVTNASNYSVSLQDTNLHPAWPGCPSPNNSPAGDACFTNVIATSQNDQGIEGHSYNSWVQAVDRNGYASPGANLIAFSCPLPPCGNNTVCGLVTSLETGLPLPNVPVDLYSTSGAFLAVNNTAAIPTLGNDGISYNYAFSGANISAAQYYAAPETTGNESSLPAREPFLNNGVTAANFQIYGAHGTVQFNGQTPGTYILLTTTTFSGSNPPTISINSPIIAPSGIVDTSGNLTIPVAPGYPYYYTCWLPATSAGATTTRKPSVGSSVLQGGAQLTTSTALTAQSCPP